MGVWIPDILEGYEGRRRLIQMTSRLNGSRQNYVPVNLQLESALLIGEYYDSSPTAQTSENQSRTSQIGSLDFHQATGSPNTGPGASSESSNADSANAESVGAQSGGIDRSDVGSVGSNGGSSVRVSAGASTGSESETSSRSSAPELLANSARPHSLPERLAEIFGSSSRDSFNEVGEQLPHQYLSLAERLALTPENNTFPDPEAFIPGRDAHHISSPEVHYRYQRYFHRRSGRNRRSRGSSESQRIWVQNLKRFFGLT